MRFLQILLRPLAFSVRAGQIVLRSLTFRLRTREIVLRALTLGFGEALPPCSSAFRTPSGTTPMTSANAVSGAQGRGPS